jgi:hypothetical protein
MPVMFRNKVRVEGCIMEAFTCKEITNFSSMYFSRANNVNTSTTRYYVVKDVTLSELSIFQWKGKRVGATGTHYVTDKEWNYFIFIYTRTWWKSNHILRRLTKHIVHLVCNPH